MTAADARPFRRMCGQFRWLAVFMVVTVGLLLALMYVIAPVVMWFRGDLSGGPSEVIAAMVRGVPGACYLFAVWSIGSGLGQLSRGRLIQPTLASTLRRVGLALGIGGVFSVFVMTNLLRVIDGSSGGFFFSTSPA